MKTKRINKEPRERGFTLVEIMAVVIIIVILAAIAVPRIANSVDKARENADIATARQIKTALEHFRLENGSYPRRSLLSASGGNIIDEGQVFISKYISKLTKDMIQQKGGTVIQKGFGIGDFEKEINPTNATNIIMIYLAEDGSDSAVQVFKGNGTLLWSSFEN